jgi:putative endonuclease
MLHLVYILKCSDDSCYVGVTSDLNQRVYKHNVGEGAKWTSLRRPVKLAYSEQHESESEALRRERQIKGWTRAKKEALIAGESAALKLLSKTRQRKERISDPKRV